MKRLLLFETTAQLKKFIRKFDARNPENIWIALTPEADYAAECAGLTYQHIEEFYDEAELIALGIKDYRLVGDFCDTLDQILQDCLSDISEIKYFSAHQFFYDWKILFDGILDRTFALKAVIENIKPNEIVAFKNAIHEISGYGFQAGSVFLSTLPIVAKQYHSKLIQIPAMNIRQSLFQRQRLVPLLGLLLKQLPGGWRIPNILRRIRLIMVKRSNLNISSYDDKWFKTQQPALVVTDLGYEVDYVVKQWQAEDVGPVIMLSDILMRKSAKEQVAWMHNLQKRLTKMWNSDLCKKKLAPYFYINGLDCYSVARPRLQHFVFHILPSFLYSAQSVWHTLQNIKQGVIIGSGGGVVYPLARHLGIPGVVYQHGGGGCIDFPMWEHTDLYHSDYYFCNGIGTTEYLAKSVSSAHRPPDKHRAQLVAVGSAALDILVHANANTQNLSLNQTRKTRKVIYVSTNMTGDLRYHSYHSFPDIWYWRFQREIIQLFARFPEIQFIAKLYPKDLVKNPVDDWFRQNPLPNIKIIRDVPFIQFLKEADLFFIDYPSTTLLQTLTTKKKIVAYADRTYLQFDPHAAELLRKRVVFSETKEQFFKDIEAVLTEDDWTLPKPVNDEFLKAYGTYLNDGRSAERAVHALVDIANKYYSQDKS